MEGHQDLHGDLILQGEEVLQFPIIPLSPEMMPLYGIDELGRYPNTISSPLNAAFQDVSYPQFLSHLLYFDRLPLVSEC